MDLTTMTLDALQILGYQRFMALTQAQANVQQEQNNITLINAEIAKRQPSPTSEQSSAVTEAVKMEIGDANNS